MKQVVLVRVFALAFILAAMATLTHCANEECKVLDDQAAIKRCQIQANMPG